jgi:outer membrane murein-binding lipoprotein Lpp
MNPIVLWRIVAGVSALVGISGTAYGFDQHMKRKAEQAASRVRLQRLEAEHARKEQQLAALRTLLGNKNEQVRILAAEVDRLRNAANEMRRAA